MTARRGLFMLAISAAILFTLGLWGCMKADKPVSVKQKQAASEMEAKANAKPEAPAKAYFTHTVKYSGETLSFIAKWYTGKSSNWRQLATENPDLNPNRIHVGDKIRIPESLMTRREPMPAEHYQRPAAKAPKKAISKPSQLDEPKAPAETAPPDESDEPDEPESAEPTEIQEATEAAAAPEAPADAEAKESESEPAEAPILFGPKD